MTRSCCEVHRLKDISFELLRDKAASDETYKSRLLDAANELYILVDMGNGFYCTGMIDKPYRRMPSP